MKILSNYQFNIISIGIMALVLGFIFHKPLTGEYSFGSPDSLSPSAVHQGINSAEEEYGEYPLWLPWIFSGLPSVHSFQNISDYYFPNFIMNILKSMGIPGFWNYIFHFLLAGMGVLAILRNLGTSWYSALFGGLSFALMPYLITMVVHGHGSQMMTTAWIPWLIWGILCLYDEISLKNLSILAFIVGLQLQRAHVQIAFYSWMAAGLLIIMLLFKIHSNLNNNYKWIIYACFAFGLGLCMAMWIYLPAINYTPYSIRGAGSGGGVGFDYATAWSFSFGEMATFLIPSFYGFGGAAYWGNMPFTDYPNYMGIIVLIFSIIGTLFYKHKLKWFFVSTAILALLLSFGKNFFLYGLFYDYFPFFNKFRVPAMLLILTQFSIAVLAGLGLDATVELLLNKTNLAFKSLKKILWILIGVLLSLLILKLFFVPEIGNFSKYPRMNISMEALDNLRLNIINYDFMKSIISILIAGFLFYILNKGFLNKKSFIVIIMSISVIDMAIVNIEIIEPHDNSYRGALLNNISKKSSYLEMDEVIKFLKNDRSKFRILPLGILRNENRWAAFQIESIEGYHPAKLNKYNQVKNEVGWNSLGLLQMLNVKYVISLENLTHPAFKLVFSGKLLFQDKYVQTNVFQFEDYIERAFFVKNLKNISNNDIQLETLRNNNFNPILNSFVEHDVNKFIYDSNSIAEIISWSPDKIEFSLDVPTKQFLLVSEIFYPKGWKITSHPDWEIYPVNSILRGVYIPTGSHRMVMEFIPDDIYYGSIMTLSSTLIIITLFLIGIYENRKIYI